MSSGLNVSVLVATYNRADVLRETLVAFTELDREGLSVEFVVIDNNSGDHTKSVVESFSDRLPLVYLFQPIPGKNRALNKALDEIQLGEVVVFTDDDVRPANNWLPTVMEATRRWSDYDIFGGRLQPIFSEAAQVPKWAYDKDILQWGYCLHSPADQDTPYLKGCHPSGANLWMRGSVFADGRRYDESIGPSSKKLFSMGSEASLVLELEREGYRAMYVPDAVVGHVIQPSQLSQRYILGRAFRYGRGLARLRGVSQTKLLRINRLLWYLARVFVFCRLALVFLFRIAVFSLSGRRYERACHIAIWLAYHVESFRMVREGYKATAPSCKS